MPFIPYFMQKNKRACALLHFHISHPAVTAVPGPTMRNLRFRAQMRPRRTCRMNRTVPTGNPPLTVPGVFPAADSPHPLSSVGLNKCPSTKTSARVLIAHLTTSSCKQLFALHNKA